MGIKLWGDLDLEVQIKKLKEEIEILNKEYGRLLEENENLLTIINKMKNDKAFYK
jgi:regulator of replication initiation timing